MDEIVYTSRPQLGTPRLFLRELGGDLRATKELGWRFFVSNFRSQYRQSWLGYVWLFIPPLATAMVWIYLGRSSVINTNIDRDSYPAYVLTGVFIWQTFAEAVSCPLQQLSGARWILSKVKVPHEAFILAGLGKIAFNLAARALILIVALLWFGVTPTAAVLLAPAGLLALVALGLAIGWLAAPLGMLYADVSGVLNLGITFLFFVTPIVYYLPPENSYAFLIRLNPVTPLLTTTRGWLITGAAAPEDGFFAATILAFGGLVFGWVFYRLAKPHLVARL